MKFSLLYSFIYLKKNQKTIFNAFSSLLIERPISYKKYAEKKKIRRKKEKSEQNLVSRINFLIDEERKIRTIIENTPIQKDNNKLKNKSSSPETITNPGTIRYKTIESNDGNHRSGIYRFKNISRKNEKKNLKNNELEIGIKERDEKDGKKRLEK